MKKAVFLIAMILMAGSAFGMGSVNPKYLCKSVTAPNQCGPVYGSSWVPNVKYKIDPAKVSNWNQPGQPIPYAHDTNGDLIPNPVGKMTNSSAAGTHCIGKDGTDVFINQNGVTCFDDTRPEYDPIGYAQCEKRVCG